MTAPLTAEADKIKLWETFFIAKAALAADKLSDFSDEYIVRVHKLCLKLFKNIVTFKICNEIVREIFNKEDDIVKSLKTFAKYLVIGATVDPYSLTGMKDIIDELDDDINKEKGSWKIYWKEFYSFAHRQPERWNVPIQPKAKPKLKDGTPKNSITNIYNHLFLTFDKFKASVYFTKILTIPNRISLFHDSSEYMWETKSSHKKIETRAGFEDFEKITYYYNLFTGDESQEKPTYRVGE